MPQRANVYGGAMYAQLTGTCSAEAQPTKAVVVGGVAAGGLKPVERLRALYADPDEWARKAVLNVAGAGKFSSDRTIAEYAAELWKVQPCPVPDKA
jgi:hypothetical protein